MFDSNLIHLLNITNIFVQKLKNIIDSVDYLDNFGYINLNETFIEI